MFENSFVYLEAGKFPVKVSISIQSPAVKRFSDEEKS